MAYTYTEQLESVQTAIRSLEENLAHQITEGEKTIIYQQLDPLYKREEWLLAKIGNTTTANRTSFTAGRMLT